MGHSQGAMKNVYAKTTVKIPDGVTVDIKSRAVVVKGPRGTLSKNFKHMQIDLYKPDENTIKIEKWFSLSKEQSAIKTCSSHIQNMIIGVTKGFKYRRRVVYAHFPTNAQISGDGKSVDMVNFIGHDIESVSKTCALINQSCSVKRKDIRKFLDGV